MAVERWIETRWNRLLLVEELDGLAYLRALDARAPTTWEEEMTLEEVAQRFGTRSRLYQDALRAMRAHGGDDATGRSSGV